VTKKNHGLFRLFPMQAMALDSTLFFQLDLTYGLNLKMMIDICLSGRAAFGKLGQTSVISNAPDQKVIKTDKAIIRINDSSGLAEGMIIETISGLKLVMESSGIELSNGSTNVRITPINNSISNEI
jgi:hypothetical protein